MTPIIAFERLFFAVFGQTSPDDINSVRNSRPEWTENLFKIVYGIYMLVSVIVLINLLIAMMSDTYQRIQVIILSLSFYFFPSWSIPLNRSLKPSNTMWIKILEHILKPTSPYEFNHVLWVAVFRCFRSNNYWSDNCWQNW